MQEIINKKEYNRRIRSVICLLDGNEEKGELLTFSKEKVIKRIMEIEQETFMPQHIPKGTKEDPDNPDFRKFTEEEKDDCWCSKCRYPFSYWNEKPMNDLMMTLRSLEELKD
jgi:hypothetical protein